MESSSDSSLEQIEQNLLLEGVFRRYGYDFRGYRREVIRRRITETMAQECVPTVSELQGKLLRDPDCVERFAARISSRGRRTMFRAPSFFSMLRRELVPVLRTYPSIRVWIPSCSTGEEVYAVAITLKECGIYDRCSIFATDFSQMGLCRARSGVFPLSSVGVFRQNYIRGGGEHDFSEYYTTGANQVVFRSWLVRNVTFAQHDLASDASFNEFNIIIFRDGLDDFDHHLKARALALFHASLCRFGILGLGKHESLENTRLETLYKKISGRLRLYRRIR